MTVGPIFVAGLERSGTSLMFALLASHPNVAMTRRTNLWTHFYGQYGDLAVGENFERCLATMMRYKRLLVLRPDPDALRRAFAAGPPTYARLFELLEAQHAERLGKPRWGDKSLCTERYAGEIIAAYPGARVLHMIRDPRDRFASSLTRWRSRRGGVGAGAAEWSSSAAIARRLSRAHPRQYRVVRYETLVGEPERTLRAVCAFVGEDYAPAMLAMDGAPRFRDEGANSSYGRRPPGLITTESIGRFRDVLSARQVAAIQVLAGAGMAWFGYEPEPLRLHPAGRLRLALVDLPFESARLLAWRARERVRDRAGRPVPAYRLVGTGRAA